MRETNLGFKIIEGTDIPDFAVFNENTNKANDLFSSYMNNITANTTSVNNLTERANAIEGEVTTNTSAIEELQPLKNTVATQGKAIELLQSASKKETMLINNVEKTITRHKVKLSYDASALASNIDVTAQVKKVGKEETDECYVILNYFNSLALNCTELFGFDKTTYKDKVIISNVLTYSTDLKYMGVTNVKPLHISYLGVNPPVSNDVTDNNVYMILTGGLTQVITRKVASSYTPSAYPCEGNIIIVLEYLTIEE